MPDLRVPSLPMTPRARSIGRISIPVVVAICLLIGIGLWWWHAASHRAAVAAQRRAANSDTAQPVSVQAARRQDIRVTVNAIGTLTAYNTAIVHAQVSGVLQSLQFKEGQQVQAGQVLAQIDPRAFEDSHAQAEGARARDRAQLDSAKVDLARYQDLFSKDAIAKQQLDTQQALVHQLEGTVKADSAAVDSAQLQVSYARVTAPISGRVGLKQADLGNVVAPGDPNGIVSIAQTKPISLVFAIPAADLPQISARLHAGKAVPVEAWDSSGKKRLASGQVQTLDNSIDTSTDTIKVKAQFPNNDDLLFPNQAVSVRLQLEMLPNVLAVPQAAVLNGANGAYVYVVNADHTVSTQAVKPGPIDGEWMAVESSIQPGQSIVVDGVDRLRDGAKVDVIVKDAPSTESTPAAASN